VLEVIADGAGIDVVNTVSLEQYLPGVVGEEVPAAWPAAALEAQAIAARSYALHQIEKAPASTTFDLYPDGRDQVYGGIDAESPAVRQAVAATARRIVLYDGSVALTYFSSSSGGMTADAADVIGFAVPYLVSVPDPWDTYSPNHEWGPIKLSARAAGKALGLPAPVLDLELQAAPDGRVVSVTATTAKGQVTLTGAQVRDDLKLRSSWFQVALLTPGHTVRAAPGEVPLQADGMPVPHAA
jgi:stage II sporulation protein D